MNEVEFKPWPKISRPKNMKITITEKMDGTNACVVIQDEKIVGIQSRNRFIEPGDDNAGFAKWVVENEDSLVTLGDGYHYGEWCGPGIQSNPHNLEEKEFYLFNTFRPFETLPETVKQVRVLYTGPFDQSAIDTAYTYLWEDASLSKYTPEGIMVYHHLFRSYVKHTYANQDGKWVNKE